MSNRRPLRVRNEADQTSFGDAPVPARVLSRWNPEIRAAAQEDEATISMFDVIGAGFFSEGVTARRIDAALRRVGSGKAVTVNINSPGGDMFEGIAIYNLLRQHPGKVTVNVLGMAASAASIIAMAGDEVVVNRGAMLMVHNPWMGFVGDHHAFARATDDLRKFTDRGVEIYTARTGLSDKEVRKMLDAETWLSADEAVKKGFADRAEDLPTANNSNSTPPRNVAADVINSVLHEQGYSRKERRELMQQIGFAAPVTGEDNQPAAPVTGQTEDFGALADALATLNRTMKG